MCIASLGRLRKLSLPPVLPLILCHPSLELGMVEAEAQPAIALFDDDDDDDDIVIAACNKYLLSAKHCLSMSSMLCY